MARKKRATAIPGLQVDSLLEIHSLVFTRWLPTFDLLIAPGDGVCLVGKVLGQIDGSLCESALPRRHGQSPIHLRYIAAVLNGTYCASGSIRKLTTRCNDRLDFLRLGEVAFGDQKVASGKRRI